MCFGLFRGKHTGVCQLLLKPVFKGLCGRDQPGQVPPSLSVSPGCRTIVTESQPFLGRVIGLVENLKHTFPFLLQQRLWDLRSARLPWVFTRVIAVSE